MAAALLVAVIVGACSPAEEPVRKKTAPVKCDLDAGPCRATVGDLVLSFEILPRPVKTMRELIFRVRIDPGIVPLDDDALAVELTMPGMTMGTNRVILNRREKGLYEGGGTIVRCPSGGKKWRATIFSPTVPHCQIDFEVDGG